MDVLDYENLIFYLFAYNSSKVGGITLQISYQSASLCVYVYREIGAVVKLRANRDKSPLNTAEEQSKPKYWGC